MGMYTELIFGARLKKDTPENVINTLQYMTGKISDRPSDIAFEYSRNPLRGGSYYFGITNPVCDMTFDDVSNQWQISTRSNIKNYESDIEKFLEWIKPYISQGSGAREFYAIVTYEEEDTPKIYYLYD